MRATEGHEGVKVRQRRCVYRMKRAIAADCEYVSGRFSAGPSPSESDITGPVWLWSTRIISFPRLEWRCAEGGQSHLCIFMLFPLQLYDVRVPRPLVLAGVLWGLVSSTARRVPLPKFSFFIQPNLYGFVKCGMPLNLKRRRAYEADNHVSKVCGYLLHAYQTQSRRSDYHRRGVSTRMLVASPPWMRQPMITKRMNQANPLDLMMIRTSVIAR